MKRARDQWFEQFADVGVDQLVSLDEFGATTTMQRTHGRAPPGERVVASVPHGHWKLLSTIAAMTVRGMVAGGDVRRRDRRRHVRRVRPRGARAHADARPGRRARQHLGAQGVESTGAALLLLPPYSPDLNPIEQAISKIKTILRKLARRSIDDLLEGIAEALGSIRPEDALGYIAHSGYAVR